MKDFRRKNIGNKQAVDEEIQPDRTNKDAIYTEKKGDITNGFSQYD